MPRPAPDRLRSRSGPPPALTPPICVVTSRVAAAVCCAVRVISAVAAPCCSTAAAMLAAIVLTCSITRAISWMAFTASCVAPWMWPIWLPISSVALPVCCARLFTSEATTAKPLPASPARAASIVAFSASRLVCAAMPVISPTTAPIFSAPSARARTMMSVCRALSAACPVIREDCVT